MQIVIEIPEEKLSIIKNKMYCGIYDADLYKSIENGIPLPKEYGRIIDESKISKCEQIGLIIKDDNIIRCFATDAPTIIKANK